MRKCREKRKKSENLERGRGGGREGGREKGGREGGREGGGREEGGRGEGGREGGGREGGREDEEGGKESKGHEEKQLTLVSSSCVSFSLPLTGASKLSNRPIHSFTSFKLFSEATSDSC